MAALAHEVPDRVPRFEIWIDALLDELGQTSVSSAYANLGQDCVMMPTQRPQGSSAWNTGLDEWGRIWKDGMYAGGVLDTAADLKRFAHPTSYAEEYFDEAQVKEVQSRYPDHCHIYGSHEIGPLTAVYMAMGFERFFLRLIDDPGFVHRLMADRTAWSIAMCQMAVSLGAEVIVVGDDAAHQGGPMISLGMWREFVLPYHRQIANTVNVPVIWHSDGNTERLLPFAVEAGFAGVHGLEPAAGMDLSWVKQEYATELVLIGNVDVRVLCDSDLKAVRAEVDRCLEQGAAGGGYMIATCNSIFEGMNPLAVREMFRYEGEVGFCQGGGFNDEGHE
jgi:uroporphyrinogen decarboxylase